MTTLIRLCDTRHAAVAADALARIGDPRALPTLWHLFSRHPDKAARHAAGRGLARIEGPPQSASLHDPRVKRAYMWLIGHKPDWNRAGLIAGVTATDALVRARVAEALGRLRDPSGAMYVKLLVADPDPRVRSVARAALRRLGE